jgi:Fe-S oxidoreductase
VGVESSTEVLGLLPGAEIHTLAPGCCGMAGSFGYAKAHFDLSRRIGERLLAPVGRPPLDAATVVASGASCRQQIRDLVGVEPLHMAEIIDAALPQR